LQTTPPTNNSSNSSISVSIFDVSERWCCLWLLPLVERGCYGWQPDDDTKSSIRPVVTLWPPQIKRSDITGDDDGKVPS
jgi:hypothetical protein